MKRWLWRITWGSSLVVAILLFTMWISCLWWNGHFVYQISSNNEAVLGYGNGFVGMGFREIRREGTYALLQYVDNGSLWTPPGRDWSTIGIGYSSGPGGLHLYSAPLLYALLLALILPAFALFKYRRRIRPGCCTHCGYDLRGSEGPGCPECGVPIVPTNDTTS